MRPADIHPEKIKRSAGFFGSLQDIAGYVFGTRKVLRHRVPYFDLFETSSDASMDNNTMNTKSSYDRPFHNKVVWRSRLDAPTLNSPPTETLKEYIGSPEMCQL